MVKEIYYPHKLILSSSFPETLMDFILINDEAWAPAGTERAGRREPGKEKEKWKEPEVLGCCCSGGAVPQSSPRRETAPEQESLGHSGKVSTAGWRDCLLISGFWAWTGPSERHLLQLGDRSWCKPCEVASPLRPGPLVGAPSSVTCLCPEPVSFPKLLPQGVA